MAAGLLAGIALEIEFTAGVWTDVSALTGRAIIRRGRDSQFTDIQPGTLTFTLDNPDGAFTPDNPLSAYYPNLVEGKRVRVRVTGTGVTYGAGTYGTGTYLGTSYRFLGKISSIVPTFPTTASQATTTITAKDALGQLQDMQLQRALDMMVLSHNPTAFYPLDEPSGSTRASSTARGTQAPALAQRSSGRGGSLAFANGPGPGVDQTQAPVFTSVDDQNGWYLFSESDFPYATSGNFSLECWFSTSSQAAAGSSDYSTILALTTRKNPGTNVLHDNSAEIILGSDRTFGQVVDDIRARSTWVDSAFVSTTYDGVDRGVLDGALHQAVYTESTSGGTITQSVYLDGALIQTNTYAITSGPIRPLTRLQVGGLYGPIGWGYNGLVAGVAVYTGALSPADVFANYASGKPRAAGDTLDQQLARLTTWTGITCAFDVTSGRSAVLGRTEGRSGLDVLLDIVRGETGLVYHDYASDQVIARNRTSVRKTTVALTIDSDADAEGGPQLARNTADRVSIGVGKSPTSTQVAYDATIAAAIGPVQGDVETTLGSDIELQSIASDRISRGRDVALRLKKLTVDLATATNDLYGAFFALLPGDRVRDTNLPTTHFGVTYKDGYAQGWTETISTDGYLVELDLSDADAMVEGVWDTSRWAFGDGVCTLQSGISSGATSAVLTVTSPPNRLSLQDSSFESAGVGNWVINVNCTIANSTSQARSGTHSLAQTSVAAGSMDCFLNFGTLIVAPGDALYMAGWAFKAGTARNCQVGISFYSRSLSALGFTAGPAVSVGGASWTLVETGATPIVAPAGAYYALPSLFCTAGAAAEVVFWDDVGVITPNMLTTDASQYPLDLNINGERVTVTTAPTSCVAPQTVTITRGVAPTVARAHSAGEGVDVWDAARWAL